MWDHLAYHLIAAGRLEELVATVKDLRYLANKILARSVYATEADLVSAEQGVPDDVPLRLLKRNVSNMNHLLNRCTPITTWLPFSAAGSFIRKNSLAITRHSSWKFLARSWQAGICCQTFQIQH